MPTLMTHVTFDLLVQARQDLMRETLDDYVPANVFVPWAGSTLKASGRGIYFIGIGDLPPRSRTASRPSRLGCRTEPPALPNNPERARRCVRSFPV